MDATINRLRRIKVDALYGKKKHFNAAERNEKYHYRIGIPLIVLNVLTSSVLLYVITDDATNWIKYIPLVLALISSLLSGLQTFLNLQKRVESHRRIGNKYLFAMKKCDRFQGYMSDSLISKSELIDGIEDLANEIDTINIDAESFPTNNSDYKLAKKGIDSGEEEYNEKELKL